jgi:hypothetical protein
LRAQLPEFPSELLRRFNCTKLLAQHNCETRLPEEGSVMKYFLDSLGWTVAWGVVLTWILYNVVKYALQ